MELCRKLQKGYPMSIELPLDQMSVADKLQMMEKLWANLSQKPEQLPSPDWHREVLLERKRLADEGKLKFVDWDTAILEIRKELGGNSGS